MKKPASLQTVVEVSQRKRDELLQILAAVRRDWQQAQGQMQQLENYNQESLQRWAQRAAGGVTPVLLQAHQQFMARLEHAMGYQQGVLRQLEQNIQHCQQQVMLAERELASLNKYAERREQVWQTQLQRQEQRSNDEMAANLHRLSTSTTSWRHQP